METVACYGKWLYPTELSSIHLDEEIEVGNQSIDAALKFNFFIFSSEYSPEFLKRNQNEASIFKEFYE